MVSKALHCRRFSTPPTPAGSRARLHATRVGQHPEETAQLARSGGRGACRMQAEGDGHVAGASAELGAQASVGVGVVGDRDDLDVRSPCAGQHGGWTGVLVEMAVGVEQACHASHVRRFGPMVRSRRRRARRNPCADQNAARSGRRSTASSRDAATEARVVRCRPMFHCAVPHCLILLTTR
jgi:hypothetical protein